MLREREVGRRGVVSHRLRHLGGVLLCVLSSGWKTSRLLILLVRGHGGDEKTGRDWAVVRAGGSIKEPPLKRGADGSTLCRELAG
eukprot:5644264-Amphidinium_carterae.3